jgi:hypothetical protein
MHIGVVVSLGSLMYQFIIELLALGCFRIMKAEFEIQHL